MPSAKRQSEKEIDQELSTLRPTLYNRNKNNPVILTSLLKKLPDPQSRVRVCYVEKTSAVVPCDNPERQPLAYEVLDDKFTFMRGWGPVLSLPPDITTNSVKVHELVLTEYKRDASGYLSKYLLYEPSTSGQESSCANY